MTDVIIRAENLGKKYTIGHAAQRERYTALRDVLARGFRTALRKTRDFVHGRPMIDGDEFEEVWALRDVNFEVRRGELIGIIGRNGAGKSTLLKILSRITGPSAGRVTITGRVASLLEVGTGFHSELTGRENIFLNGTILGMTRGEIKRKFDEIVSFAEVERYLDTPVKRYSSGMHVRLAFAVAAHLEPEILMVDEVLAVGDVQFQKKCLGKMEDVAHQGRTVLFVTHQIASVTRLCQKALWLDAGRIEELGDAHSVCSRYLALGSVSESRREWTDGRVAPGNEWARLESVEVISNGAAARFCDIAKPIDIRLTYFVLRGGKVLIPSVHFFAEDGTFIFVAHDWHSGWRSRPKSTGRYRTSFTVPSNFLSEGRVTLNIAVATYMPFELHFHESDVVAFTVVDSDEKYTARGDWGGHFPGVIRPIIPSSTEIISR